MSDLIKHKIKGSILLEVCFAIIVLVGSVGIGMNFISGLFHSPTSLNKFKAIQDMKAHISGYVENDLIEIKKTEVNEPNIQLIKCELDLKRAYKQEYSILKRK